MIIFQQALLFIIVFICAYTLIDRICKCIEHCATAKAYSKFRENGVITSLEKVQEQLKKSKEIGHETKNKESGID